MFLTWLRVGGLLFDEKKFSSRLIARSRKRGFPSLSFFPLLDLLAQFTTYSSTVAVRKAFLSGVPCSSFEVRRSDYFEAISIHFKFGKHFSNVFSKEANVGKEHVVKMWRQKFQKVTWKFFPGKICCQALDQRGRTWDVRHQTWDVRSGCGKGFCGDVLKS